MMASPFTMLGILGKSRRATTAAHPVHATSRITQDALRAPRKSNDSFGSDSNESSSSSRIIGDNTVLVEEPSYTIVPKTENRTDIDQEWTDVGVDGRVKTRPSKAEEERMAREAREGEEERKREEVERQKREEEERRRAEERRNEDRKRAEEERRGRRTAEREKRRRTAERGKKRSVRGEKRRNVKRGRKKNARG
ncbi:hypothetical protein F5887DRAFT_218763 [Amanita rubescens]|nr:hypothetical protein F5887DRAFT_218763 [Amanita rubescens]